MPFGIVKQASSYKKFTRAAFCWVFIKPLAVIHCVITHTNLFLLTSNLTAWINEFPRNTQVRALLKWKKDFNLIPVKNMRVLNFYSGV